VLGLVALLAWAGVLLQLGVSARLAATGGRAPLQGVLQALGYFTVLTNLLLALSTSATAIGRGPQALRSRGLLAAVGVYIAVVGIVYALLLRSLWAPRGVALLADTLLHGIVPVAYVLWWLVLAARGGLSYRQVPLWLVWPLAYFAVSLIVGSQSGRYLYPFADVGTLGLAAVMRNALMLLGVFWILGMFAVLWDRWRSRAQPEYGAGP
jgi:hypothetical protein